VSAIRVRLRRARAGLTPSRLWFGALVALWLAAGVAGLWVLWSYDNAPGEVARAPERWPETTTLQRAVDRPTLVMLAHPHCTCTTASLGELAEAIARAQIRPRTYVVFMTPASFREGWERTELWRSAASLPGATVVRDENGREAQRFGAATSGQTLLYDERGRLVFSGGVTGSRAHAGDNVGRQSLVALLNRNRPERSGTNVFGCPLFNAGS
jgi:hypothetical protein